MSSIANRSCIHSRCLHSDPYQTIDIAFVERVFLTQRTKPTKTKQFNTNMTIEMFIVRRMTHHVIKCFIRTILRGVFCVGEAFWVDREQVRALPASGVAQLPLREQLREAENVCTA